MKKAGILNSEISRVLSYMGHTDLIAIGDCGLPIPDTVERIDLALKFGVPTFMETLEVVVNDMKVEKIVLAEEIKTQNPKVLGEIEALFAEQNIEVEYLERLNNRYNDWIENHYDGEVFVIDKDNSDFVENAKVLEELYNRLDAIKASKK